MQYCVYITTYKGDLLPQRYIGSSSVKRVQSGYRGSVRSRRWRKLWEDQMSSHPDLFSTEIVSVHDTRQDALEEELRLQQLYNVVGSDDWINEAYAKVNGFAGRNVSGELNPMFGCGHKISKWCADNPELASERSRKAALTQWADLETRSNRIAGMKGKSKTRKTLTEEEFKALQKAKSEKSAQQRKLEIPYDGSVYYGWDDLLEHTGVTKHLYNKYYINGQDPLARKGLSGPAKQF